VGVEPRSYDYDLGDRKSGALTLSETLHTEFGMIADLVNLKHVW